MVVAAPAAVLAECMVPPGENMDDDMGLVMPGGGIVPIKDISGVVVVVVVLAVLVDADG